VSPGGRRRRRPGAPRASAAVALAAAALAGWGCWIKLDASDKTACESQGDCLDGYQCIDRLCTRAQGEEIDAGTSDGGDAGMEKPPGGGAGDCSLVPGDSVGCICGFKATIPVEEWPGYQSECDYFGNFCGTDCCPPGMRIDVADPTSCVPAPESAPDVRYLGPWPDFGDEISEMKFWWVAFGPGTCSVAIAIDGEEIGLAERTGIGQLELDKFDPDVALAALDATLECTNGFGTVTERYSIPAASERVTVTGLGTGYPQRIEICWQVFPFFGTTVAPYNTSSCEVGICPADESFDPNSLHPCSLSSYFARLRTPVACIETNISANIGDRAYVSCHSGNVQDAVYYRVLAE